MKLFNVSFSSFKALGLVLVLLPNLVKGQAVTVSGTANIANVNTIVLESMTSFAGSSGTASNIPNWQLAGSGSSGNTLTNGNQSSGTAGGWYGTSNISFLGSGNATNGNATLRLRNTTGSTITGFRVVYDARMWRSNASGSPTVTVTWSNNATSSIPSSGGLANSLSSLGFSDATANISTGTTLTQTTTGLSIANNDYIFLRWIHSGNSNSDNLGWDEINFIPQPTTQASAVNFSSVSSTSMTTGWTNGNGARRAVFMREGSAGTITNPTDGTSYTASTNWAAKGTQLGTSGYYCISDGTANSVNLTNLVTNTTYYFQVFEYNSDASGTAIYRTYFTGGTPAIGNQKTTCPSNTATTGDWSAGGTWTCGIAPISTTNVTIPTGVTVTLDVDATINNLTFTGGGKLMLGANTLTINGNATGSSTDGWVITDGVGALKAFNMASEKTFPVGTATVYAPVKVDNSATSRDFSVKVGTTFSGTPAVPAKMVQLEWNVTPSVGDGSVNNAALTFQWPTSVENGSFNRANPVEIAHFNTGTSTWDYFKLATVGSVGPDYTATASGFTSFSPFAVGNQNALSVDLLNITAQSKGTKNVITWSTASEKNNAYFEVQHTTNGLDFETISDKIKGNGTTNVKNDYAFEHSAPSVIQDYYRLKQVDNDGTTTLSKVVSVAATGKNGALKVYPTLATDKLNVSLESKETVEFNIYNLIGQSVQSGQLTGQKELIINHLPSGVYFLKVGNATVKFSKN